MTTKISHIIVLFSLRLLVGCEKQKSLTFVIDDTSSMTDDIDDVRSAAGSIMNIVLNEKSSQIQDIVLVTFNDPNTAVGYYVPAAQTKLRTKTRDPYELKKSLDSIKVYGGYDCPEASLSGIKLALQQSLPGSYLFVFTDASSNDHELEPEVSRLCQEKQTQVVFVLTGYCELNIPIDDVYTKIAAASTGQVFQIDKSEVPQVIEYVKETIRGDRTVITSKVVPARTWTPVEFHIDDKTEYAVISASGNNVQLIITDKNNIALEDKLKTITWTTNAKVYKLLNPQPGTYKAWVSGSSEIQVLVFGRTDFTFQHGFAKHKANSLKDTITQPISGTRTYLYISVNDEDSAVEVKDVEILNLNEKIVQTLSLRLVHGNLYKTRKLLPPCTTFKIAVTALDKKSGNEIRRIATTPITPQQPIAPPHIKKDVKMLMQFINQPIEISCKLDAGSPATVSWYFKKRHSEEYAPLRNIGEIIQIPKVGLSHDGYFKCIANNKAGQDIHTIELRVLQVSHKPPKTIEAKEYTNLDIECSILQGNPQPTITWLYKDPVTNSFRTLDQTGNILRIKNITMKEAGRYQCKARNAVGIADQPFDIIVKVPPKNKNDDVEIKRIRENSTLVVHCSIVEGNPKSTIFWQFKDTKRNKYKTLNQIGETLRIESITMLDAGLYKCFANNSVGSAEHLIQVIIQAPPRIVFVPPNKPLYEAVEGDMLVKMTCQATGFPIPTITWTINGNGIPKESKKFHVDNGDLIINEPVLGDTNVYNCVAVNSLGEDVKEYSVHVTGFDGYGVITEELGVEDHPYQINCSLPYTNPNHVRWYYNAVYFNKTGPSIYIKNATQVNNGKYTCRVSDSKGSHSATKHVLFGTPPLSSATFVKVDFTGDYVEIKCDINWNPIGKIEWFYNGETLKGADKPVLGLERRGQYVCRSTNPFGILDITFNVTSKDCLIERSLGRHEKLPLILDMESSWPAIATKKHYVLLPNQAKYQLVCNQTKMFENNYFNIFPKTDSVIATCDHDDLFIINGNLYKFSDLNCNTHVLPKISHGDQCLGKNSEIENVKFHYNQDIDVYESCIDNKASVSLYTKVEMTQSNKYDGTEIDSKDDCVKGLKCCYENAQLVNEEDVTFGPSQRVIVRDDRNYVNYCRPTDGTTNWYDIERQVRNLLKLTSLTVWSGATNYTTDGGLSVPKYMWKVVSDGGDGVIIVHENDPEATENSKLCKDVCNEVQFVKFTGARTYCCNLEEFQKALNIPNDFGIQKIRY